MTVSDDEMIAEVVGEDTKLNAVRARKVEVSTDAH
jgi:hypothetical protein